MHLVLRSIFVSFAAIALTSAANGQDDVAGSQDPPGMTRMPSYYIADYQVSEFDSHTFKVRENGKDLDKAVEGKHFEIRYNLKDGAPPPSQLQVLRNYQNAARAAGGQVLRQDEESSTIRIVRGGSETWVDLSVGNIPSGLPVMMTVIVKQAMTQEVTMDAGAMASGLADNGEVAIYGIYFDTAKSDLKPESDPALAEIAKLLNTNPGLKVYIVGHTDMVGEAAANVKLAQARAQSVVNALVTKNGIAGGRLIPFGAGPYAPVATNKTEEGRAKNRRVELVEIATK